MPERLKGHDWKSCVPTKIGTEGSNPSLSASLRQGYGWQASLLDRRSPGGAQLDAKATAGKPAYLTDVAPEERSWTPRLRLAGCINHVVCVYTEKHNR
jgi:hypothetical protein